MPFFNCWGRGQYFNTMQNIHLNDQPLLMMRRVDLGRNVYCYDQHVEYVWESYFHKSITTPSPLPSVINNDVHI